MDFFFSSFSLISLIADGPHHYLSVVTKDLPISPRFTPYDFLSRCKFSTLTTRQPMVEFYLLTFPRFPLQKNPNPTLARIELTTSALAGAGYVLNHTGDEGLQGHKPFIAFSLV